MGIYDLISQERLVDIAANAFESVIKKSLKKKEPQITSEPTLAIARSMLEPSSIEEILLADQLVDITKSLQNAVGNFHQEVLGSFPGWKTTGQMGGIFDIRSELKVPLAGNKKVVAEVKMRHNTIKASDEKGVFDALRSAYITNGKQDHIAYIIQIIPKNRRAYDEPWKVSGREADENVRSVDGVSGYHLVSGQPNTLKELLEEFPTIFALAFKKIAGFEVYNTNFDTRIINSAILHSLPEESIFVTQARQ